MKVFAKLLIGFLIISSLAGLIGYIGLRQLEGISNLLNNEVTLSIDQYQQNSGIDVLTNKIQYLQEVLEHSLAQYTFTQKEQWKQRYFAFLYEMNPAIESLIKQSIQSEDKALFIQVKNARMKLENMEILAIKSIDDGRVVEVVAMLNSTSYLLNISNFNNAIRDYRLSHRHTGQSLVPVRLAAKQALTTVKKSQRF